MIPEVGDSAPDSNITCSIRCNSAGSTDSQDLERSKRLSRLVARPQQRQRSSRAAIAKNVGGIRCYHSDCNFIRSPNFGSSDTSYY